MNDDTRPGCYRGEAGEVCQSRPVYTNIHDESAKAEGGSSITQIKNFVSSNKDLLLGVMFGLVIMLGFMLFFEYRTKAVSDDLAIYNSQQLQIQAKVNEGLMAALICKR